MEKIGGGKVRERFAKLRRDTRALSPVFAVLILVAITVIAGIIVYMFTSGYLGTMMGGGTAGQEKVAIEAVEYDAVSGANVWAKSVGGGTVRITEAILKDSAGQVAAAPITGLAVDLTPGALNSVSCGAFSGLPTGVYTVTLVSQEGNQFVSQTFKAP